jgi:glycosyltransferase involved in cell wall biosynthesis
MDVDMPKRADIKQVHRLKFALVTETFKPEINGVAMTLGKIASHLSINQHQVQVIRPKQNDLDIPAETQNFKEYLVTGMPIPFYKHLKFGLPSKKRLIKLWADNKPDVVHIATEGPLGWSALQAAKKLNIPVISSYHTNFHQYSKHYGANFLMRPIENYLRYFHNQTLATLAPTKKVVKELEMTGYKNVSIMARGVDTSQFCPTNRSAALRKSWGVNNDDLVVIHVGRLAKEKNILLALEAFEAIQKSNQNTKLVFVGDGPMREELSKACPQAIFSGSQQGQALAEHYASADLFIFPSITETFGNVVPEALASGLCVVAYDYAAAGDIIKHGHNGLLAPFNQSQDLIQTALDAAQNSTLLNQCKKHAVASILDFRWDSVIEELERLIYATANGFQPIRITKDNLPKSKPSKNIRVRQRAIRLALHKKINLIKL